MVNSRTSKELKRRQAFKTPNKIELIVCEGSTTEPVYFNALRRKLRLRAVRIHVISPKGSKPIEVVEHAITKKENGFAESVPYDKIWCVIDVEIPEHKTLNEAWEKATKTDGLELILTNPCIEYWFLLHFKKHSAAFDSNVDAMRELKAVHPTYRKSRISFDIIDRGRKQAIKNSKDVLKKKKCGPDIRTCNPATHVHKLVEHLQNIAAP